MKSSKYIHQEVLDAEYKTYVKLKKQAVQKYKTVLDGDLLELILTLEAITKQYEQYRIVIAHIIKMGMFSGINRLNQDSSTTLKTVLTTIDNDAINKNYHDATMFLAALVLLTGLASVMTMVTMLVMIFAFSVHNPALSMACIVLGSVCIASLIWQGNRNLHQTICDEQMDKYNAVFSTPVKCELEVPAQEAEDAHVMSYLVQSHKSEKTTGQLITNFFQNPKVTEEKIKSKIDPDFAAKQHTGLSY